ncbi:MAG: hypothetical protein IPO28_13450, partial [Holophagaceae bacterium]|nr:hypothetical protein [Holophagaceae bacterium]
MPDTMTQGAAPCSKALQATLESETTGFRRHEAAVDEAQDWRTPIRAASWCASSPGNRQPGGA